MPSATIVNTTIPVISTTSGGTLFPNPFFSYSNAADWTIGSPLHLSQQETT